MHRALALAAVVLPTLAFAQEAKPFNAKDLEKEFAPVPVFAKGGVVDNEVMVNKEADRDFVEAVYVVRTDVKKVVEFYQGKLNLTAKKDGEAELGTEKYTLAIPVKKGAKRVFKVMLQPTDEGGNTVITLTHRKPTEDDRPEE